MRRREEPEERAARVDLLREAVRGGRYVVGSPALAEALRRAAPAADDLDGISCFECEARGCPLRWRHRPLE